MPNDTFTNANPTNTLTLSQVNAQDIGFLYPVGSHLVCWQDTDEWETPLAWQNAGAVTYDATKDKPKISSRTATVLTLGANLENNNFTAGSYVYQVDGFKPLQVADGAIAAEIGARGYLDTGFRFRTTGAGNIYEFKIIGNHVYYVNGSGAASYNVNQGHDYFANPAGVDGRYLLTFLPPDKSGIISAYRGDDSFYTAPYYSVYLEAVLQNGGGGSLTGTIFEENKILHRIFHCTSVANDTGIATRGYIL
jgi:hypothetical protein